MLNKYTKGNAENQDLRHILVAGGLCLTESEGKIAMKYREFLDIVAKYTKDEREREKWIKVANEMFSGPSDIHACGEEYMLNYPEGAICLNCGEHFIFLDDENE